MNMQRKLESKERGMDKLMQSEEAMEKMVWPLRVRLFHTGIPALFSVRPEYGTLFPNSEIQASAGGVIRQRNSVVFGEFIYLFI